MYRLTVFFTSLYEKKIKFLFFYALFFSIENFSPKSIACLNSCTISLSFFYKQISVVSNIFFPIHYHIHDFFKVNFKLDIYCFS